MIHVNKQVKNNHYNKIQTLIYMYLTLASNFGSSKNPSGIPSVGSLSCRGNKKKKKSYSISVSTKMFLPSVAYHSLIFLKYYLLYGCYMFFKSFYYNSEKKIAKILINVS